MITEWNSAWRTRCKIPGGGRKAEKRKETNFVLQKLVPQATDLGAVQYDCALINPEEWFAFKCKTREDEIFQEVKKRY